MATSEKFVPGDFVVPKHNGFNSYGLRKGMAYLVEPINDMNRNAGHDISKYGPWIWITDKEGEQIGFPEDQFRLKKQEVQMDPDFSLDEIHQAQKTLAKITKNKASA